MTFFFFFFSLFPLSSLSLSLFVQTLVSRRAGRGACDGTFLCCAVDFCHILWYSSTYIDKLVVSSSLEEDLFRGENANVSSSFGPSCFPTVIHGRWALAYHQCAYINAPPKSAVRRALRMRCKYISGRGAVVSGTDTVVEVCAASFWYLEYVIMPPRFSWAS